MTGITEHIVFGECSHETFADVAKGCRTEQAHLIDDMPGRYKADYEYDLIADLAAGFLFHTIYYYLIGLSVALYSVINELADIFELCIFKGSRNPFSVMNDAIAETPLSSVE